MTNNEVLKKAIEKALDNGWKQEVISRIYAENEPISSIDFAVKDIKRHMDLLIGNFIHNPYLLFSHDFAKAFWGEEAHEGFQTHHHSSGYTITYRPFYDMCENQEQAKKDDAVWKYHLQQMVLEENPIDYLRNFIND